MTEKTPHKPIDAGLRSLDHYKLRLPKWRLALRDWLIPVIRWETPILSAMQDRCRSPALDSYFAFTANLGTHTAFMLILPILFWCGNMQLGRGMVHVLASGVFFSGFIKDMLCLPRPLSPPLHRISRSASAALEYGFPSTHSTNAVSVAIYAIYCIRNAETSMPPNLSMFFQGLFYFYAVSIVLGRLYCGMHGYFDVVLGSMLGALLAAVQCLYGDAFDDLVLRGSTTNILVTALIVLILVRIHPEPADDCPCFDDSVAFSGVFIGIQIGGWHFSKTPYSQNSFNPGGIPYSYAEIGFLGSFLRILLGVAVIFAWREIMKPTLLGALPPVFRIIEGAGLSLPRKFFLRASQYTRVPALRKDDNVIPPVADIPSMISSLRHPRKRAISVGPQSEADAYEAMAFRQRKRRESQGSIDFSMRRSPSQTDEIAVTSGQDTLTVEGAQQILSPPQPPSITIAAPDSEAVVSDGTKEMNAARDAQELADQASDQELFRLLHPPRVRYDVEVVTKLIVYTGIAYCSLYVNPILFELVGLGMGSSLTS